MSDDGWLWTAEHLIPSEHGAGRTVIGVIVGRLQVERWTSHDQFSVRLALEEAIANAIRHGNHSDAGKQVRVVTRLSTQRIMIEVVDQGHGFEPESIPDCRAPENLDKPCGRGLMLMRAYMTSVEYNARGNAVIMEKHRSPGQDPPRVRQGMKK